MVGPFHETRKTFVLGCLLVTMLAVIDIVPIHGLPLKNSGRGSR